MVSVKLNTLAVKGLYGLSGPVIADVREDGTMGQDLEAIIQNGAAVSVAGGIVVRVHDNADETVPVPEGGCAETVASSGNGAGFEAVRALVGVSAAGEKFVGVGIGSAVEGHRGHRRVVQNLGNR